MPMNPRLLRPLASGFNPRQIAGLLAWHDAADSSTLFQNSNGTTAATAESDPVGYWGDKSGNGRHLTQAVNNDRPLLNVAEQNGLPALQFDGSNDCMTSAAGYLQGITSTVFLVAQRQGDTTVSTAFSMGRSTDAAGIEISLRNSFLSPANNLRYRQNGATVRRNGAASLDTGTSPTAFLIAAGTFSAAAVIADAGDPVFVGAQRGAAGTNAFFMNGRLGEVLAYNRVLSLLEIQRVESYLSNKWGIALT